MVPVCDPVKSCDNLPLQCTEHLRLQRLPKIDQFFLERFVRTRAGFDPFQPHACTFGGFIDRLNCKDQGNCCSYEPEVVDSAQNRFEGAGAE